LFISWNNWVPSYVRDEIRKKTGINLDNTGNIIEKKGNKEEIVDEDDINAGLFNDTNNVLEKPKKQYNDISEYKPTGRLVYNPEILQKIEKKVAFNPDNN
jgi:UTP-glucose-1-phosphate uridylyltransferase